MTKAQIEIMGLVLIVILITLGLFFSVAFKQPQTSPPITTVYGDEKLASDYLITFLETTDPVCQATMRDIAIDCVRHHLSQPTRYHCENKDSCTYLSDVLTHILDKTLNDWHYSYKLAFYYEQGGTREELLIVDDTDCTEYKPQAAPGLQPISLYPDLPGKAWFQLNICR